MWQPGPIACFYDCTVRIQWLMASQTVRPPEQLNQKVNHEASSNSRS
jgi:hypothetical protein